MTKAPSDYPMALTVKHVAEIMGIGRSKAYEIIQNPKFPVIREGRKLIIPRDAFLRWLDPNYNLVSNTPNPPTQKDKQLVERHRVTDICTKALVDAVNNGTITVQDVVTWAIGNRFGGGE